ncbi:DUF58 domain-containing protein [Herbiconiux liangxiaofengii]|uniref:DUF58 domain-containing protein n=1 Tax=Herbiconiux liangxiaofengii TaxID=3342795 RepID=UPI0035B72DBD
MTLTGRAVALLALGVLPVVLISTIYDRAVEALLGWIALVLVLVIVDLVAAASPRRLAVERTLPARVRLGETSTSTLYLTNTGRRMLRAVVRDAWQPSAGPSTARQPVAIPPGERRALSLALTPFRRGERRTERITVRSTGPLGLAGRQATLTAPGRIRVLPPFNARKHLPSRLARLRELDGRASVMIRGQGTEFDSLREYVRGDDVRSIDWRATARHTDVMVRTWRPERDRRVVIVIDTGRTQAARIDDETRIDTAFESALLLAALATRAGDRVDVILYDRRLRGRVHGASGPELLSRMVDVMAPIDPDLIEMDWSAVPGLVRQVTTQRSLVVLATAIDAPGISRELMAIVPQLTRNHMVVVSSVTDPDVLAGVLQRSDREEVYRAAAAERALLDAARVTTVLKRFGADVITGSPADLPPALADRYIALKAAGRL